MTPGFPDGGTCFDCGNGCFDCGMGCSCTFNPANVAPWQPPFTAIGSTGWRDSTMSFCGGIQETVAMDLWSDSSGIYAAVFGAGVALGPEVTDDDAGVAQPVANGLTPTQPGSFGGFGGFGGFAGFTGGPGVMTPPGEAAMRTRVWHNEGAGWGLRLDGLGGSMFFGLTGIDRGPLILYATPFPEELACRLGMTTRGGFVCYDVDPIQDVVVVNRTLAYALMGSMRLLSYDGSDWHSHPVLLPYPAARLWADENNIIAVGNAGTLLRLKGDEWQLEDVGVLEGLTAIWGKGVDDLWIGTSSGRLLHHDGTAWRTVVQIGGKTCDAHQPVTGIWGSGDVLYAHTPTAVVRWKDGVLTTLGNWTCGLGTSQQVRALAGRSENEVFVGLVDQSFGSPCGSAYVAYFDGAEFHRM